MIYLLIVRRSSGRIVRKFRFIVFNWFCDSCRKWFGVLCGGRFISVLLFSS